MTHRLHRFETGSYLYRGVTIWRDSGMRARWQWYLSTMEVGSLGYPTLREAMQSIDRDKESDDA